MQVSPAQQPAQFCGLQAEGSTQVTPPSTIAQVPVQEASVVHVPLAHWAMTGGVPVHSWWPSALEGQRVPSVTCEVSQAVAPLVVQPLGPSQGSSTQVPARHSNWPRTESQRAG
jgi:hypothetical protein